jgi:hypothetical protein
MSRQSLAANSCCSVTNSRSWPACWTLRSAFGSWAAGVPGPRRAALLTSIASALARPPATFGRTRAVALGLVAALAWRSGVRQRVLLGALALAGCAGLAGVLVPRAPGTGGAFVLTLLDVGQGDGMALRFPDGRALVLDGGMADERYDNGARVMLPALRAGTASWTRSWRRTATHDHIGGRRRPRDVPCDRVVGRGMLRRARRAPHAAAPRDRALPTVAERGAPDRGPGYSVDVLWPPRHRSDRANDEPRIGRAHSSGLRATRCGCCSPAMRTLVERALVERGLPRCTVLKVGHHGRARRPGSSIAARRGGRGVSRAAQSLRASAPRGARPLPRTARPDRDRRRSTSWSFRRGGGWCVDARDAANARSRLPIGAQARYARRP